MVLTKKKRVLVRVKKAAYRYYVGPNNKHTNKVVADLLNTSVDEIQRDVLCYFGDKASRCEIWEVSEQQLRALKGTAELDFNIFSCTNRSRKPQFMGTNSAKRNLGVEQKLEELSSKIHSE